MPPHILIFNPDQWRGDVLGHLGNLAARTPNLDRLTEHDAVSFANAFCQNPVCTPSRCSFMTGWYPHVRGHRTMFHMLRPDEPMLLRKLRQKGYFVWWGGKNDVIPAQHGYQDYCDIKYRPSDFPFARSIHEEQAEWRGEPGGDRYYSFFIGKLEFGELGFYADSDWANVLGAIDFIRNYRGEKPFCIYLPLSYPHPPYAVEEPWFSLIDRQAIPPPLPAPPGWKGKPSMLKGLAERLNMQTWSPERWIELRAVYYGMCARVDHQFGMVLDALRQAGFYEDTAVFFFSDHGDFTGDYGLVEKTQNTFEDCLTRVPLIIKPPSGWPLRPGVRQALVELIDVPATIEVLVGIQPGYTHFGRHLLDLMAGETDEHRDAVFCEGGRLPGERHCMELESVSNQVPTGLYYPRLSLQRSEGPEHTKATMCRTQTFKYVRRLLEEDELYDLRADPGELVNRAGDQAYREVLLAMKERMLTFYQETCDVVPFEPDERV